MSFSRNFLCLWCARGRTRDKVFGGGRRALYVQSCVVIVVGGGGGGGVICRHQDPVDKGSWSSVCVVMVSGVVVLICIHGRMCTCV